jgi:hypothetical protein
MRRIFTIYFVVILLQPFKGTISRYSKVIYLLPG